MPLDRQLKVLVDRCNGARKLDFAGAPVSTKNVHDLHIDQMRCVQLLLS